MLGLSSLCLDLGYGKKILHDRFSADILRGSRLRLKLTHFLIVTSISGCWHSCDGSGAA